MKYQQKIKSLIFFFIILISGSSVIFAQQECSSKNLLERLNSFNSEASTWEMIRFMKAAVKVDRTIDLGPYAKQKRQEPCNGFVFPSSKHITTNAHCLTFVSNIEVEFQSGEKIPVKGISYYGNYQDIAVLELVKEAPAEAVLSLSRYTADSMVGQKVFRWPNCQAAESIRQDNNLGSDAKMFDQSKIDQLGTFSGQTSLLLQTPMLSTKGLSGSMMLDKNLDIVGVFSAGITYIEEGRNYGDRLRKPAFQIIPKNIASEMYDQAVPLLTWYQTKENVSYVNYLKALEYVLTPSTNNPGGELDIISTKENYLNLAKNNYSEEVLPPELIAEFIHLHVSKYIFQRVQFKKKDVQELVKALEYARTGVENYPHIAKFWEQAGQIYHYSEIENLNLHSYTNDKNRCYAYGKAYQIETSNPIYKKTLQNFKCK